MKKGYFEEQEALRPMRVMYQGDVTEEQIRWGGHDDPRPLLVVGREYTVSRKEVHSWHTKLFLEGFEDKSFNSVWFVDVT